MAVDVEMEWETKAKANRKQRDELAMKIGLVKQNHESESERKPIEKGKRGKTKAKNWKFEKKKKGSHSCNRCYKEFKFPTLLAEVRSILFKKKQKKHWFPDNHWHG